MTLHLPMFKAEIEALLPHRDPFRMLDRVDALEPGVRGVGVKWVDSGESWVPGHFPGQPILPGVLIAEALAQLGGVIAMTANPDKVGQAVYLLGFDKLRFRRPVRPGDELRLEVTVTAVRRGMWFFDGEARVGDERAADGSFLATLGTR